MASLSSAPLALPALQPVVIFVMVHERDVADLAAWAARTFANIVIQDSNLCFGVAMHDADQVSAELAKSALPFDWSVIPVDGDTAFAAALIDAAQRHAGRDVLQTTVGTDLPFAWDLRLRKAVYASEKIAAATAMCDFSAMYALVDEELRPAVNNTLVDRIAYTMGDRSYYDVPRVHPHCTYFRRSALDLVLAAIPVSGASPQATLDILARRLRAGGWSFVLCDYLYIGDEGSGVIAKGEADDIETHAYLTNHPLAALRRAVNAALRAGLANISVPGLDSRPVQLHVMHFWGGGLDKWVRDFSRAEPSRINLVFSSFRIGETGGQRLVLYSDPADTEPIRVWDIAQPIRSTLSSSIEYRRILEQIIREFGVESIIVSSLIGHTLDAIDQPVKTLVVCHDYYPICQAINPQFGSTCERCTLDDLRRCAKSNPLNSIFTDQTSEEWHEMRSLYVERLLTNRIEMVAPSPSVITTMKRLAPRLEQLTTHLIPHGIDLVAAPLPIAIRTALEPLRIVVLGRLSRHKGTELLREACAELRQYAEITLVGCGGNGVKLAAECGWDFIEKYQPEELPGILQKIAPHAGLLASVIPETFSYTLSELNQLGIPSIATALGSFNDRIVHGESGFLFNPTKDALIEIVCTVHAQPELLAVVAARLLSMKPERRIEAMVGDYHKFLPPIPRPIARFEVGIGMQTGLTDPYRHLSEAYAHVNQAYAQIDQAYADTKASYENTRLAYDRVQRQFVALKDLSDLSDQWASDFDALNVPKSWWRLRSALELTTEFREKLRLAKEAQVDANDPAVVENPESDR